MGTPGGGVRGGRVDMRQGVGIRGILVVMGLRVGDLGSVFSHHLDLPPPDQPVDFKSFPAHGGVYAFSDEDGRLIQMIGAQNVRRSVSGRLAPPEDGRRARRAELRAIAHTVWWTPTHSLFEGKLTYLDLARTLRPGDYRKDLSFGPAWFATIRPADRLPRWRVDSLAFRPGAVDIGPFKRRGRCADFVALLEDLFDLCRYHSVLEQTPDGEACAYFEMGKCPAPCNGSITLDQYHRMIDASVRFATGAFESRLAELEEAMRRAAAARAYARAARLRETISAARRFIGGCDAAGSRAREFRYLIVQRGETRRRVKPFYVDRGFLSASASVAIQSLKRVAPQWLEWARARLDGDGSDAALRSERVWLVSHFLAKGDKAPGVFVRTRDLSSPDNLVGAVLAKLQRSKETKPDNHCKDNSPIDPAK